MHTEYMFVAIRACQIKERKESTEINVFQFIVRGEKKKLEALNSGKSTQRHGCLHRYRKKCEKKKRAINGTSTQFTRFNSPPLRP